MPTESPDRRIRAIDVSDDERLLAISVGNPNQGSLHVWDREAQRWEYQQESMPGVVSVFGPKHQLVAASQPRGTSASPRTIGQSQAMPNLAGNSPPRDCGLCKPCRLRLGGRARFNDGNLPRSIASSHSHPSTRPTISGRSICGTHGIVETLAPHSASRFSWLHRISQPMEACWRSGM